MLATRTMTAAVMEEGDVERTRSARSIQAMHMCRAYAQSRFRGAPLLHLEEHGLHASEVSAVSLILRVGQDEAFADDSGCVGFGVATTSALGAIGFVMALYLIARG